MSDLAEVGNSPEFLDKYSHDDQLGSMEELQVEPSHWNESGRAFRSETDTLIGCRESETSYNATQEIMTSDPEIDAEIDADLAAFIQRLMTSQQPGERLKSLYDNTNNPSNIPALREIRPNSDLTCMVYAQNLMLKGVAKVAHIMDAIYKNIDKVPAEMSPGSLMLNFNDAMRLFGAANLKMAQQSE